MHWENRDEACRVGHPGSASPLSGLDEKDMAEPVHRATASLSAPPPLLIHQSAPNESTDEIMAWAAPRMRQVHSLRWRRSMGTMQDERGAHACPVRTCAHAHNALAHAHVCVSVHVHMAVCMHLHVCTCPRAHTCVHLQLHHAQSGTRMLKRIGISMPMLISFSLHSVLCPAHP